MFSFCFQHAFETRVFLIHWEQHVCSPETPAAMRHPGNRENEALKCGNNLTQTGSYCNAYQTVLLAKYNQEVLLLKLRQTMNENKT